MCSMLIATSKRATKNQRVALVLVSAWTGLRVAPTTAMNGLMVCVSNLRVPGTVQADMVILAVWEDAVRIGGVIPRVTDLCVGAPVVCLLSWPHIASLSVRGRGWHRGGHWCPVTIMRLVCQAEAELASLGSCLSCEGHVP